MFGNHDNKERLQKWGKECKPKLISIIALEDPEHPIKTAKSSCRSKKNATKFPEKAYSNNQSLNLSLNLNRKVEKASHTFSFR
jgi:hypothetical protein